MDAIPDILPTVLLSKLESAAKDRNQKNKHYKQIKLSSEQDTETNDDKKANLVSKTSTWTETDRRSTNDRRKQIAKRGRWLESRNSTDRRKNRDAISITI